MGTIPSEWYVMDGTKARRWPDCPEHGHVKATLMPGGVIWYDADGDRINRIWLTCERGHNFEVRDDGPGRRWRAIRVSDAED